MKIAPGVIFRGWGRVLTGYHPSISIEITRECPLRCPGCYAYEPRHLHALGPLRTAAEHRGQALIDGVVDLVRRERPLHASIVGGEPLLRSSELDVLLPKLSEMGVAVRVVTSAVCEIPRDWAGIRDVSFAVSVDGPEPEHNARRAPATYDQILKNIAGHSVIVHSLVTGQLARRKGSLEEFLLFWSSRPEALRIWFSLYTPQRGEVSEEVLTPRERLDVCEELESLRPKFPKLELPYGVVDGYRAPPASPDQCIFARWVPAFTPDLTTTVSPCQLGGDPDCSQCGCMPAAGLKALGDYRLLKLLPIRSVARASTALGEAVRRARERVPQAGCAPAG
jgi:organic radical activating enzyme